MAAVLLKLELQLNETNQTMTSEDWNLGAFMFGRSSTKLGKLQQKQKYNLQSQIRKEVPAIIHVYFANK